MMIYTYTLLKKVESPRRVVTLGTLCMDIVPFDTDSIREEPLMIWGGARAKVGKKLNGYSPGKKKLNNPEEEEKKLISWLARKKNSTRILCSRPPQIIIGPSLIFQIVDFIHKRKGKKLIE